IRVRLTRALYPGTQISADCDARIEHGVRGWRMYLRLGLARATLEGSFIRWLLRKDEGRATVVLTQAVCAVGSGVLELQGRASLAFAPDWTMRFKGTGVARIRAF